METEGFCPSSIIYIRRTKTLVLSFYHVFLIFSWRTVHVLAEDLRIIAGAGKPDLVGNLRNRACIRYEKGEAFLYPVAEQVFKWRLVQRLLEDAAEFALARMARLCHLIQRYRFSIVAVDEYDGILET